MVHAEVSVRECTLVAPRAGMVATRVLEPGEPVQPGSVILAITDVSEARTRFYLPNAELAGTVQLWEWIGDDGATTFSY